VFEKTLKEEKEHRTPGEHGRPYGAVDQCAVLFGAVDQCAILHRAAATEATPLGKQQQFAPRPGVGPTGEQS